MQVPDPTDVEARLAALERILDDLRQSAIGVSLILMAGGAEEPAQVLQDAVRRANPRIAA